MYRRVASDGDVYEFVAGSERLDDYNLVGAGQANSDRFTVVCERRLDDFEGIAFGRGNSENPDRAEAYAYFDARGDDEDSDGNPDKLEGEAKILILNTGDRRLAQVYRRNLNELRTGDPAVLGGNDARGDWGIPFPYQTLRNGVGEVMGDSYKIAIALKLDGTNTTDSLSLSNSQMLLEGYIGEKLN